MFVRRASRRIASAWVALGSKPVKMRLNAVWGAVIAGSGVFLFQVMVSRNEQEGAWSHPSPDASTPSCSEGSGRLHAAVCVAIFWSRLVRFGLLALLLTGIIVRKAPVPDPWPPGGSAGWGGFLLCEA